MSLLPSVKVSKVPRWLPGLDKIPATYLGRQAPQFQLFKVGRQELPSLYSFLIT